MRRLAKSLEVAPGALYWHYPSKQDLLGAIANQLLADLQLPESAAHSGPKSDAEWDAVVSYCTEIFAALTSVRDGAEITLAALASGTTTRDPRAELQQLAGPTGEILFHYVLGAAMEYQAGQSVATALGTPSPADPTSKIKKNIALIVQPHHQ